MKQENFKYYAFISYSHKDQEIAKELQKRLERYHLLSNLQKSHPYLPKSLKPIFIDESNLVAKGSLKTALQSNLERSNYLIVICSPNSAQSEYVNGEVDYFIKLGRTDRIIPLIVDGTPHAKDASMECFPPAILALPREKEILGIDVNKFGRRDAFLRVIATMLGLDLDGFISFEARERKRKAMIFASIAAAFMLIAGIFVWRNFDFLKMMLFDDMTQYNIGLRYYSKRDYASALEVFEKAADKGDPDAQYQIGHMYFHGEGVDKDYTKAKEWFEKAAYNGNVEAEHNFAYMYMYGLGIKQDYKKAMEWLKKAADHENHDAQFDIGYLYFNGWGVKQDYEKAMEWYQKAANKGNVSAQFNIGRLYQEGLGVKQDYKKAMEWYQKAAANGDTFAPYYIGYMYDKGLGVEQDYDKAIEWYIKAAYNGDSDAQERLNELKELVGDFIVE